MQPRVYISGALTNVPEPIWTKARYERMGHVCKERGWNPYVPHLHTDPDRHAHIPDRQVYAIDRYQVRHSDLILVDANRPSFGVGQEIEIANRYGIPVVLVCEARSRVSSMVTGCPIVVAEIRYQHFDQGLAQLAALLDDFARGTLPGQFRCFARQALYPAKWFRGLYHLASIFFSRLWLFDRAGADHLPKTQVAESDVANPRSTVLGPDLG